MSGGAMMLGKLSVPRHLTNLDNVGQGPTVLSVGTGGGAVRTLFSHLSFLFFHPLSDID